MTTARTLDKLDSLVGVSLERADVQFALRNWDDAPGKLQRSAVSWFKDNNSSASLQSAFIEADERAVKAIADLSLAAQELVLSDKSFKEDVSTMVAKASGYTKIHENLWRHLITAAKRGALPARSMRRLAARFDCPDSFLKAAGITAVAAERSRREANVTTRSPRGETEPTTRRGRREAAAAAAEPEPTTRRGRREAAAAAEPEPTTRRGRREAAAEPAGVTRRSRRVAAAVANVRRPVVSDDFDLPEENVKTKRKAIRTEEGGAVTKVRKVFKRADLHAPEKIDDFIDEKKVGKVVRTVRRPRT